MLWRECVAGRLMPLKWQADRIGIADHAPETEVSLASYFNRLLEEPAS